MPVSQVLPWAVLIPFTPGIDVWRVYVECVLLMAGLQPHLAWVTDWTLAGWGCTPGVQSNHGTQDKPAINTHTRGGATVMTVCTISSANTISLNLPINILNEHLPVSCVGGPQRKPLRWRVLGVTLPQHAFWVIGYESNILKHINACVDAPKPHLWWGLWNTYGGGLG